MLPFNVTHLLNLLLTYLNLQTLWRYTNYFVTVTYFSFWFLLNIL